MTEWIIIHYCQKCGNKVAKKIDFCPLCGSLIKNEAITAENLAIKENQESSEEFDNYDGGPVELETGNRYIRFMSQTWETIINSETLKTLFYNLKNSYSNVLLFVLAFWGYCLIALIPFLVADTMLNDNFLANVLYFGLTFLFLFISFFAAFLFGSLKHKYYSAMGFFDAFFEAVNLLREIVIVVIFSMMIFIIGSYADTNIEAVAFTLSSILIISSIIAAQYQITNHIALLKEEGWDDPLYIFEKLDKKERVTYRPGNLTRNLPHSKQAKKKRLKETSRESFKHYEPSLDVIMPRMDKK